MNQQKNFRLYEIFAGIGFLLATVSYSIGSGMVEGAIIQPENAQLRFGVSLELVNSFAVVIVGLLLFLRLKQISWPMMLGYLFSRIAEAALLTAGGVLVLCGVPQPLAMHNLFFSIAMIILGIASTIFCFSLQKRVHHTKWLFIVGVAGYTTLLIYAIINLFATAPMWLFAPGAIFEIVFPVWLIFKGFSTEQN